MVSIAESGSGLLNDQMPALESLLESFAKRARARWWIGDRPQVRDSRIVEAIAANVGLPTAATDPLVGGLTALTRKQAARILALAATASLIHGRWTPRRAAVKDAEIALANLSDDATYLSNGLWQWDSSTSWNSLTSATIDCGVIGFDETTAFVFWVEEED